jgi:NAD+ kinase
MSKRFFIVDRQDLLSSGLSSSITAKLIENDWELDKQNPELVLSIGGDGTMLQAFHDFKDQLDTVSFVGVHTGHLGFYTDWKKDDVEEMVDAILHTEPKVAEYPLVEVSINDGVIQEIALNEITIKNNDAKTFICNVSINGEKFEDFRGDGLCVSTPSGSTAYNKGLNGAIVHHSLESMQLSEIASINNKVFRTIDSSVILPKGHVLEITGELENSFITVDHLTLGGKFDHLKFVVSDKHVRFARYREHTFWNRVKSSFI